MTEKAREVLEDCRLALAILEDETDLRRWRVLWAGAVALTRAVGHVLVKVDGASNPEIKRAANNAFKSWNSADPAHEIFRRFIEIERNNILKQYRFNYHPLESVDVAVVATVRNEKSERLETVGSVFPIGDNIYRPILDGFREGDDARDVLADALEWWEIELAKIEKVIP
jgi:hypothetical protein